MHDTTERSTERNAYHDPDRRPIKSWATRLGGEGEPLTIPEAQLLATIACADRLTECLTALQDLQIRTTRLELFLARLIPEYDPETTRLYKALVSQYAAQAQEVTP